MRFEHIELDISTATCSKLLEMIEDKLEHRHDMMLTLIGLELRNLENELRARLQRRDIDVQCPKKNAPTEEWLDT